MYPLPHSPKNPAKMVSRSLLIFFLVIVLLASLPANARDGETKPHPDAGQTAKPKESIYDFSLVDQDGKVVPLSNYKGKVLLIVNLASQSFYSTQIAALNDLEKTYGPQGLQVIGIPSPDFGNEELKDPASVRKYYTETAQAGFPVFASAKLTGISAIPLYQFLCDPKQSVPGGDIKWNYTKFLIDKNGAPLARYEVDVDPADIDFHVAVESALSGKFKKPDGGESKHPAASDSDADDE
jgi:glutathione peroxidase